MLCNVPLVNQLTAITTDQFPSENAQADCVPASVAADILYYYPALGLGEVNPDHLKDLAYGQGYTGGTDPMRYAATAKLFGVTLNELNTKNSPYTDAELLLRKGILELQRGRPFLGAIPSMWGLSYSGGQGMVDFPNSTHEVCFCDWDGQNLTAMNPWPVSGSAFYQTQPLSWWMNRLVYGRIHTTERAMAVPTGWTDDGTLLHANGFVVQKGFRDWVMNHPWSADDVPLENEHPADQVELAVPFGPGNMQCFRHSVLVWTPTNGVWSMATGSNYQAALNRIALLEMQVKQAPVVTPVQQSAPFVIAQVERDLKTGGF